MDIQRLRYFLEVVRQKNFSRAAEICHVSQPSLSQQIKKLEEEVDGPLFLRNRGRIKLTPLGVTFLSYAQAIMASVASAEEFVAESRSEAHRTIRLGAIPTIAPYLVPEVFAAIRQQEPKIKFELLEDKTEVLTEALMDGSIDVALLSPPTSIDHLCDHLTLRRDELMLTLPAGHPLTKVPNITPAHLKEETIILLEDSQCLSHQVSDYCSSVGLTADISNRGSQIITLQRLVELGFGLTFTPRIAVDTAANGPLVFRSLSQDPCYREIQLTWLHQPMLGRTLKAVLSILEKHFN